MPLVAHYVLSLALIAGGSALFLRARDGVTDVRILGGLLLSPLLLQVIGFTAAAIGILHVTRLAG